MWTLPQGWRWPSTWACLSSDGEFSAAEPDSIRHTHQVHDQMTELESDAELLNGESEALPGISTPLPRAFQDLIDGLELPDAREDDEG